MTSRNPPTGFLGPVVSGDRLRAAGRGLVGELLAFAFPPRCASCGDFGALLCDDCHRGLEPLGEAGCRRCGGPRGAGLAVPYCIECLTRPPGFATARSAFLYRGPARDLVAALKSGQRELGPLLAELAAPALADIVRREGSLLVSWVPSHRSVERRRGYNQAEVLARRLARLLGLPAAESVLKTRKTSHQQGLDRQARQHNLRGAFVPRVPAALPAGLKGVVLVDDVYTTGATAAEVAAVAEQASGLPVHVFTFCRTPLAGGLFVD